MSLLKSVVERLRPHRSGRGGTGGLGGLLDVGTLVRFQHPLLRSAVYRSAGLVELREVHRVLAGATDPGLDLDRRAWHLARATVRPDEAIAAELSRRPDRARARANTAAAAAFPPTPPS